MVSKRTKWTIGGFIGAIIGMLIGFFMGANIGGNYYVDFTLNGLRGYEAVGFVGAITGGIIGGLIGGYVTQFMGRKNK